MRHYYVKIIARIPVPREREYRISASGFGTAVRRAIIKYREEFKRKRIERLEIKIEKL